MLIPTQRITLTPSQVIEDEDMEDADDVPELFLPEPSRPPGPRPPYRGLSITIPPEEEIDPGGGGGNPALVCSPGLTIRIWKVRAASFRVCCLVMGLCCLWPSQTHLIICNPWAHA